MVGTAVGTAGRTPVGATIFPAVGTDLGTAVGTIAGMVHGHTVGTEVRTMAGNGAPVCMTMDTAFVTTFGLGGGTAHENSIDTTIIGTEARP